jgi:hypothetical protein
MLGLEVRASTRGSSVEEVQSILAPDLQCPALVPVDGRAMEEA